MDYTVATDLVTFHHPAFWGKGTNAELRSWLDGHLDQFWSTVLTTLVSTGVKGLELTFSPGSINDVAKCFGSGLAFKSELDRRGLRVVSAFIADGPKWDTTTDLAVVVADAQRRATFLREVGAEILVASLPMRRTFGAKPPLFVDHTFMARMADIAHVVGEAVSELGLKLAVHTESNSTLWYERDIDLFMVMTDPCYVWLCPDSCHISLGGGDPVRVAQKHNQRIILAHWKDASGPITENLVIDQTIYEQQQRYMVNFGSGVVDWRGWAAAMKRTPGKDIALIELDAASDPIGQLGAGTQLVANALNDRL